MSSEEINDIASKNSIIEGKKRKCWKCGARANEIGVHLVRYPKFGRLNALRCERWANYMFPDSKLTRDIHEKLHKRHIMLCTKHFPNNCFLDNERIRMIRNACPDKSCDEIKSEVTEPDHTKPLDTTLKHDKASHEHNVISSNKHDMTSNQHDVMSSNEHVTSSNEHVKSANEPVTSSNDTLQENSNQIPSKTWQFHIAATQGKLNICLQPLNIIKSISHSTLNKEETMKSDIVQQAITEANIPLAMEDPLSVDHEYTMDIDVDDDDDTGTDDHANVTHGDDHNSSENHDDDYHNASENIGDEYSYVSEDHGDDHNASENIGDDHSYVNEDHDDERDFNAAEAHCDDVYHTSDDEYDVDYHPSGDPSDDEDYHVTENHNNDCHPSNDNSDDDDHTVSDDSIDDDNVCDIVHNHRIGDSSDNDQHRADHSNQLHSEDDDHFNDCITAQLTQTRKTYKNKTKQKIKKQYGHCRCCLKKEIHHIEQVQEILECLNIEVSGDPRVSQLVCGDCGKFLRQARIFRDMAAASQRTLISAVQALDSDNHLPDEVEDLTETKIKDIEEEPGINLSDETPDVNKEVQESEEQDEEIPDDARMEEDRGFSELSDDTDVDMDTKENEPTLTADDILNYFKSNGTEKRQAMIRENLALLLQCSTIVPFSTGSDVFHCIYCHEKCLRFKCLRDHVQAKHLNEKHEAIVKSLKCITGTLLRADISRMKCRLCDERFVTIDNLVEHLVDVHDKKYNNISTDPPHNVLCFDMSLDELKCLVCGRNFDKFKMLLSHMNQHYGSYLCHHCGKKFLYYKTYISHVNSKHKYHKTRPRDVKRYIKCKCGQKFENRRDMWYHKKNDKRHCTASIIRLPITLPENTASNIRLPVTLPENIASILRLPVALPANTASNIRLPVTLPKNTASIIRLPVALPENTASNIRLPVSLPENIASILRLPVALPVNTASNIRLPVTLPENTARKIKETAKQTFDGIQIYECDVCNNGTEFSNIRDLRVHKMEHLRDLKENVFECDVCRYITIDRANFKKHINRHFETYECQICTKKFISQDNLKSHVHRHFFVKFRCPLCEATYVKKTVLKRHVKEKHPDVTVDINDL